MSLSRVLSRASRAARCTVLNRSVVFDSPTKVVPPSYFSLHSNAFWQHGISSSPSPEPTDRDSGSNVEKSTEAGEPKVSSETGKSGRELESEPQAVKMRRKAAKRTAFSDSESESEKDLCRDDLSKLLAEKEELLKSKHKEIEKMQDKVLRSYAEMENVMDRTRREAENAKKYAVQNFAKGLLDVADNLGRASSVVKESYFKIDAKDDVEALPLLKTLLEGVDMTEKQLVAVFKKFGVEKYDPTNEPFDPHRHNAVFQMPDNSKPPGTVAAVLKAGYMLHERVLRPAEVGVTQAVENDTSEAHAAEKGSEASAQA